MQNADGDELIKLHVVLAQPLFTYYPFIIIHCYLLKSRSAQLPQLPILPTRTNQPCPVDSEPKSNDH